MSLRVYVSATMTTRCLAGVSTDEGEVEIASAHTAKGACTRAAKQLRKLADRFDQLAKVPAPLNSDEQDRINRSRARRSHAV